MCLEFQVICVGWVWSHGLLWTGLGRTEPGKKLEADREAPTSAGPHQGKQCCRNIQGGLQQVAWQTCRTAQARAWQEKSESSLCLFMLSQILKSPVDCWQDFIQSYLDVYHTTEQNKDKYDQNETEIRIQTSNSVWFKKFSGNVYFLFYCFIPYKIIYSQSTPQILERSLLPKHLNFMRLDRLQ